MRVFAPLWQSFTIALDMLRMHKLRAFLTMLGVIIGVMAVTIIVMVMNGFTVYMQSQFDRVGAGIIYVMYDRSRMRREMSGSIEGLTMDDVAYLKEKVPSLDVVSPITQYPAKKVTFGEQEFNNPEVLAQDERYQEISGEEILEGRFLSKADMDSKANVCVIGLDVRDALFPDKKSLGKLIQLPGINLEIVGVVKRLDGLGDTNAKRVLMPITTFQDKWTGMNHVFMIAAKPKKGEKTEATMDRVWEAMMVKSNNRRVYRVDSNESINKVLGTIFGSIGMILAAIAALSLLVGGIGIMNIMLVSVSERTREIGLRKALGARSGNILLQFLVESATLSLVGGLIGMAIAGGIGLLVKVITVATKFPSEGGLPTPFPIDAAIISAVFSAGVGLVFGLYPAMSAAKMDPIVALRRE